MLISPTTLAPCIGVFDSGVGGLSVLSALRRALPAAQLLYVADSAHAPYGERDEAFVVERSRHIAAFLRSRGAWLLVVACNTATAAAVHVLRAAYPQWPVVGVEPGVKPAVMASRNGRIGVMATSGTLASTKFSQLIAAHAKGAQVHAQACPGLARAIEEGNLDAPQLLSLVRAYCAPLRAARVDTVVLGCTHYPFITRHIQAALGPGVQLVDTAEAVAQRALALSRDLHPVDTRTSTRRAKTMLWTTADVTHLQHIARSWLDFECEVAALTVDSAEHDSMQVATDGADVVPGTGIEPVRPDEGVGRF